MSAPARRARIVSAAVDTFASGGYGASGMGDVASRSGVTRAVVYDYFPSKKELFLAALQEQSAAFLGYIGASITGEGTPEQRMRATVDTVFTFAERYPNAWRMLFVNATHGDAEIDAAWSRVAEQRNHAVVELLADDLTSAGVDPSSKRAGLMVEMLVGALTRAVEWRHDRRGIDRGEAIDAAMDLLWSGLARRAGGALG
ncbi:transcriptional regulator, TetR family [Haloechinothrix alba]|uniref:Transcriptional regulator, TetR family n=2 Tax=Haloechinothrix alba TaxID=664784 RepID=A0A238Z0U7_9PSEU|nr:transcriptional regulator, TetR family [Haloechinothrix alba]